MSKPKKIKPNDLRGWTRESLYMALCADRAKLDTAEALLRDERGTNADLRGKLAASKKRHDDDFGMYQNDMKNMRTEIRRWESAVNTFGESLVLALDRIKVLEAALAKENGS